MGFSADALRPHWLAGINAVNTVKTGGFRAWVLDKHYQVHKPILTNQFSLTVSDPRLLCNAVAADASRLATAAFESMQVISGLQQTPKASAWTIIRAYYAAYYASNAICRLLGTSVSKLDTSETNSVFTLADLYGQATGVAAIQPGMYHCVFDNATKVLQCAKINGGSGGSHEMFWSAFLVVIRTTRNQILSTGAFKSTEVATKLIELGDNLCRDGYNGGNWLSHIRNDVTYRHGLGTWFPYHSGVRCDELLKLLAMWTKDPMEIDLIADARSRIKTFMRTCAYLVSLSWDMLQDIARRCPRGRSFVHNGPNAYLCRVSIRQPEKKAK